MDYLIRNKFVSVGGSSVVRDMQNNDQFFVKGRIFTFTRKKFVTDLAGKTLFIVRNKFFHIFLPKVYICDGEGNVMLMLKKQNAFSLRADFDIFKADGTLSNYSIDGDIIGWNFTIKQAGLPIATVHRNFNVVDSFTLSTSLIDQAPFLIALVIAIDNWVDKLQDSNN